jgi:tripartite-type tricarboxylate transporter receptor subunit TctC
MPSQLHRARRLLLLAALSFSACAFAQTFPAKPVKWIVGYPAGGGTDFLARTVGAQMSVQLGQPFVVDNRPGAAAILAAEATARAPGDGYTVFTADNGVLVYNQALYKRLPYDARKDFAPLGLMARTPLVLVAAPSTGARSGAELLAHVRAQPGRLSYASPGNGSPHHLAMELLKSRAGLFVLHVPYRGAAPAMQDVMGGQVPLMVVDSSSGMAHIRAQKLVPLLVFSAKRLPHLPDTPTAIELGFKDVEAYAWQGLVVPAATPGDIQQKLSTEMQSAVNNPAVKKKLAEGGWETVPSDSNLMAVYTQAETRKWHALIRERKITVD